MTAPDPVGPDAATAQVVIRPVALSDLGALLELAGLAGAGLTTLPTDADVLEARIAKSLKTFERLPRSPAGETYLFVMETHPRGRVIGASGIVSKVGGFEPFYSYIIETALFESRWINVRREVPMLRLHEEHDGPCEVGSLFLHPSFRGSHNGRFLQLVRFLFMAEHPEAFETRVVSEIRGVSDDAGRSPFWDALGRHFFGIDFTTADRLSVTNKKFIADLMPDHPIYIPLLPREAQEVIGVCHEHSRPAVRNLEVEGFRYQNAVDIFDAGPVYACDLERIRAVRESRRGVVAEVVRRLEAPIHMLGTTGSAFRAVKGPLLELPEASPDSPRGLRISADCAAILGVRVGEPLRYVPLLPGGAAP